MLPTGGRGDGDGGGDGDDDSPGGDDPASKDDGKEEDGGVWGPHGEEEEEVDLDSSIGYR